MVASRIGGDASSVNSSSWSVTLPNGIQAGDVGFLVVSTTASVLNDPPAGWTIVDVYTNNNVYWDHVLTRTMDGTESGTTATVGGAGTSKVGMVLEVWRDAYFDIANLTYTVQVNTTSNTCPVPAASFSGTAVFFTVWSCRNSTAPTSVTKPTGTTLSNQAFTSGGGAMCVAGAYSTTQETDGSVGSGSWVRNNTASTNILVLTVPIVDTVLVPPTAKFKEWSGTAWVDLTTKEWNGSAWVSLTPKEL